MNKNKKILLGNMLYKILSSLENYGKDKDENEKCMQLDKLIEELDIGAERKFRDCLNSALTLKLVAHNTGGYILSAQGGILLRVLKKGLQ